MPSGGQATWAGAHLAEVPPHCLGLSPVERFGPNQGNKEERLEAALRGWALGPSDQAPLIPWGPTVPELCCVLRRLGSVV
eukprot:13113862-Alexandrium_andersonii.AAC.1